MVILHYGMVLKYKNISQTPLNIEGKKRLKWGFPQHHTTQQLAKKVSRD